MRDQDHGLPPLARRRAEEVEYGLTGIAVERTGRLVGEQNIRSRGKRPSNGHPLLLPSRQLMRTMREPPAQPEAVDEQVDPLPGLTP